MTSRQETVAVENPVIADNSGTQACNLIYTSQAAAHPYNMIDGQPKPAVTSVMSSFETNVVLTEKKVVVDSEESEALENVEEEDSDGESRVRSNEERPKTVTHLVRPQFQSGFKTVKQTQQHEDSEFNERRTLVSRIVSAFEDAKHHRISYEPPTAAYVLRP